MKLSRISIGILVAIVLAFCLCAQRSCGPGGDGVLARFDGKDGRSYLLCQKWNDWSEPYSVSFYLKVPDGRWGWCYVDHQSVRLRNVAITASDDEAAITVYSNGKPIAKYDNTESRFSLIDDEGRITRSSSAPQEWRTPPGPNR